MNKLFFALLFFALNLSGSYSEVPACDKLVSVELLQKIDLREVFEAVYTIALEQGTLDKLPASFLNCLADMREGNNRVKCGEFVAALKFVLETLVVTRDFETRYAAHSRPCPGCEARINLLERDMTEVFDFLDDRLLVLESICGVVAGRGK